MTPDLPNPDRQTARPGKDGSSVVAAQRELEESIKQGNPRASAKQVASEVFVHGLLMSRAESSHPAALKRREARIASILARLDSGGPAPRLELLLDEQPAAKSAGFFRRFAVVAAGNH